MNAITRLALLAAATTGTACAEKIGFDDVKAGELPAGWTGTKTGSGESRWTLDFFFGTFVVTLRSLNRLSVTSHEIRTIHTAISPPVNRTALVVCGP